MSQNVFLPGLNDFCSKYLVVNSAVSLADAANFPAAYQQQRESFFEHLLLFDKISLKVHGENVVLALMLDMVGEKGLEALLEQRCLGFVLWAPAVMHFVTNIPGVDGIVAGNMNSGPHGDPEQSIELGLNWLKKQLSPSYKRKLIKKVLPTYIVPPADLATKTVAIVKDALGAGRLKHYEALATATSFRDLDDKQKEVIAGCGTDLLDYSFLIENNMTSFSEYKYYSPFWGTASKFSRAEGTRRGFAAIATLEGFPNFSALYGSLNEPLKNVSKIRQSRDIIRFRRWLEETAGKPLERDFAKEYIDAIAGRRGLFDSARAKFAKSVAMTALGTAAGAAVGGIAGAAVGATVGQAASTAIEAAGGLGVDLLDSFILERLSAGWSPRMFFDKIREFQKAG